MSFGLIWGTGFELGSSQFLGQVTNYVNTTAKTGSYGTYCGNDSSQTWTLPVNGSDFYFSFWMYHTSKAGTNRDFRFYLTDNNYIRVNFGGTTVGYGVNGTSVYGIYPFITYTWYNLQLHIIISDSGLIAAKFDGNMDCNYSADTKPGSATAVNRIYMVVNSSTASSSYDDFSYGTGGWPGDIRYSKLVPTADTATKYWMPYPTGTATNYTLVDEVPPSGSDYVYSNVSGTVDLYTLDDFTAIVPPNEYNPIGVTQWVVVAKDSAGDQKLRFVQKLNSTEAKSDIYSGITTTYHGFCWSTVTDPEGNPWTTTGINALEIGQEMLLG